MKEVDGDAVVKEDSTAIEDSVTLAELMPSLEEPIPLFEPIPPFEEPMPPLPIVSLVDGRLFVCNAHQVEAEVRRRRRLPLQESEEKEV